MCLHLGTSRFGTNTAGTQVWSWYSDAFGNGTPSGSVTVNLRMPGKYSDSQSGLFYNWNRYYNPAIGRYISSDPIGLNGGLNTFNYVEASPVMYSDPEGKIAIPIGYVLWGGAIISLEACNLIQPCKKTLIDGAQAATDAAHKGLKDLYDWCTNDNTQDEEAAESAEADSTSQAAAGAPMPDPDDEKEMSCDEHATNCLASDIQSKKGPLFNSSACITCRNQCVQNGGIWPDIARPYSGRAMRCDYWNF